MIIFLIAMLESDFLRFFVENRELEGWSETATSWLTASVVIAVLVAGLMFSFKALKKYSAANIKQKTWSRGETVVFMLIGLLPVFLTAWFIWYRTRDFVNIVGVTGLLKGVIFSWILYLILMLVGHLASPWRREIV